jgi:hypothetical protein
VEGIELDKHPLFSIRGPSTGTVDGPHFQDLGSDLLLTLTLDDEGRIRKNQVLFVKTRAIRQRNEPYCTSWHVEDAYDTVCEVRPSSWVAELLTDSHLSRLDEFVLRHFIIYLDSFGCLEVVAESARLRNVEDNNEGDASG